MIRAPSRYWILSFGKSRRAVSNAACPILRLAARTRTSSSELTQITLNGRSSGGIGITFLDVGRALEHNENTCQGSGLVYNPLVLCVLGESTSRDSGIVSGVFATACSLGGALGFAIVAGIASTEINSLVASGVDIPSATNAGYHMAFNTATGFASVAVALGGIYLRLESRVK